MMCLCGKCPTCNPKEKTVYRYTVLRVKSGGEGSVHVSYSAPDVHATSSRQAVQQCTERWSDMWRDATRAVTINLDSDSNTNRVKYHTISVQNVPRIHVGLAE